VPPWEGGSTRHLNALWRICSRDARAHGLYRDWPSGPNSNLTSSATFAWLALHAFQTEAAHSRIALSRSLPGFAAITLPTLIEPLSFGSSNSGHFFFLGQFHVRSLYFFTGIMPFNVQIETD